METSNVSVQIPVVLAGRRGCIRAAVIKGAAPLLISRMALKNLNASIAFGKDCLTVFGDQQVPLITNEAGQYMVNLLEPPCAQEVGDSSFAEVMMSESDPVSPCPQDAEASLPVPEPEAGSPTEQPFSLPCHVWSQEHVGVTHVPSISAQGPKWKAVRYRVVRDADTLIVLDEQRFVHEVPQGQTLEQISTQPRNVIVEFFYEGEPVEEPVAQAMPPPDADTVQDSTGKLSAHQSRQLRGQIESAVDQVEVQSHARCVVMEVFSPPRFTEAVGKVGLMGRSYDITTGCDLSQPASRKQVEDDLDRLQPDLLVLCPPCTDESGWFHLNSLKWDKWEYLRRKALSRSFIRWCCKLFHKQAKAGRQAMFEHPLPAETWTYP